jgi:hypothetical protein
MNFNKHGSEFISAHLEYKTYYVHIIADKYI